MTTTGDRSPCPACAEPIVSEARLCPHCRMPALFRVQLEMPLADGRARYRVARALASLGKRPIGDLQAALGTPGATLATSLTRAEASRWVEAVAAGGATAGVAWTGSVEPRTGPRVRTIALAAAGAVVALVAGLVLTRGGPDAPAAVAPTAGPRPAAALRPLAHDDAAPLSTRDLAALAVPSTVSLRCHNGVGAGFFVAKDTLLTNEHVLCRDGSAMRVVFSDGREGIGTVHRSDSRLDIAMVKVAGAEGVPLVLGDAGALKVGDRVMLIGSPVGMEFTVHDGMVSNLGRPLRGVAYVQIDAKVNPGNSGGPLLDSRGRVVGIVTLKLSQAEGIALALPINYAFSGRGAMLPYPSPGPDPAPFDALVAQAGWKGTGEAEEPPPLGARAALVGGHIDQYRRIVARVLRASRTVPPFEEVSFKFWSNGREICALKGDVREWKKIDEAREPRLSALAESIAGGLQPYTGEAALRVEACGPGVIRSGVELELDGGDPRSGRIRIN